MTQDETLNSILAVAVATAQTSGRDATKASEEAAKAFAAGLAAFRAASAKEDPNARYLREAAARNVGGAIGATGGASGQLPDTTAARMAESLDVDLVPKNWPAATAARMATPSNGGAPE